MSADVIAKIVGDYGAVVFILIAIGYIFNWIQKTVYPDFIKYLSDSRNQARETNQRFLDTLIESQRGFNETLDAMRTQMNEHNKQIILALSKINDALDRNTELLERMYNGIARRNKHE